jgi:hypothetical protein
VEYADTNDKVWTGAYVVRGSVAKGVPKVEWIILDVIKKLVTHHDEMLEVLSKNKVEDTVAFLTTMYGFGSFMAGQIAADLTYTKWLSTASDLNTWAPIGPGSTFGLGVMLGLPGIPGFERYVFKQPEFNRELILARESIVEVLGITDLTLHDVQNCFCEYGKYAKSVMGTGRPRSYYKPETAY